VGLIAELIAEPSRNAVRSLRCGCARSAQAAYSGFTAGGGGGERIAGTANVVHEHVREGEFRRQRRRKASRRACVNIDPRVFALFPSVSASLCGSLSPSSSARAGSLHVTEAIAHGCTVGKHRALPVKYARLDSLDSFLFFQRLNYRTRPASSAISGQDVPLVARKRSPLH